jgi:hypothetical protein
MPTLINDAHTGEPVISDERYLASRYGLAVISHFAGYFGVLG